MGSWGVHWRVDNGIPDGFSAGADPRRGAISRPGPPRLCLGPPRGRPPAAFRCERRRGAGHSRPLSSYDASTFLAVHMKFVEGNQAPLQASHTKGHKEKENLVHISSPFEKLTAPNFNNIPQRRVSGRD